MHLSEEDQTRRDQEVGSKSQKAARLYYWLISKNNNQYFDHKTSVLTLFCLIAASTDAFSGILRTISYFDFPTLKKATKNFHQGNLLGRGGFGPVYRVLFLNLWNQFWWYFLYFPWTCKFWDIYAYSSQKEKQKKRDIYAYITNFIKLILVRKSNCRIVYIARLNSNQMLRKTFNNYDKLKSKYTWKNKK